MPQALTVIIIDKSASLKTLSVKNYNVADLYKKCGFKQSSGFSLQVEWPVTLDGQKYLVQMYGKLDGKVNMENKYEFPPPVDHKLYFGACALVCMLCDDVRTHINLSIELWNKIYEKLFGGFEDLTTIYANADDDDDDDLGNVATNMKTMKGGYLKDGFVVDSDTEESIEMSDTNEHECSDKLTEKSELDGSDLEDVGSELSEEPYYYSD